MGRRLNIDKQLKLEPIRMQKAIEEIEKIGLEYNQLTSNELDIWYKGNLIKFFPYSGWHSGKGIKDGRGLNNLLKQIKK